MQLLLIVLGESLITHIINGDTVLKYSRPTIGASVVQGYDSTIFQPGKPLASGYIALQREGQPILKYRIKKTQVRTKYPEN